MVAEQVDSHQTKHGRRLFGLDIVKRPCIANAFIMSSLRSFERICYEDSYQNLAFRFSQLRVN